MSSESEVVPAILRVLLPKVQIYTTSYNSQNVAGAFYGLQSMSDDCTKVRYFVSFNTESQRLSKSL